MKRDSEICPGDNVHAPDGYKNSLLNQLLNQGVVTWSHQFTQLYNDSNKTVKRILMLSECCEV